MSVDLNREVPLGLRGFTSIIRGRSRFDRYDVIAFGDYCWSTQFLPGLIDFLVEWQPDACLVAGGYQVTSTPDADLTRHYPQAERLHFLRGFAENSLLSVLRHVSSGAVAPRALSSPITCVQLASPWLAGELGLDPDVRSVRWETKRGCEYACDFCEFKSATNSPRRPADMVMNQGRLLAELELFRDAGIKKVNVLDPLFNIEGTYEALLDPMLRSGISFTLQTRIERLEKQADLIDAASENPRLRLEIGVQTLDGELNRLLCRANRKELILSTLSRLKERNVAFETNLIFGIPGQTVRSHVDDIDALMAAGCPKENIRCFPLRIPRGSRLEARKESLHVKEFRIAGTDAVVGRADGFDELDWYRMLLASEMDAGYLDKLKDLVAEGSGCETSRTSKRSVASDLLAWTNALDAHGYRFSVMVAAGDGSLRRHAEPSSLRFLEPGNPLSPSRLAPGVALALRAAAALFSRTRQPEATTYVLLRQRFGPFVRERPARVLRHELDVTNRRLVLYATWRLKIGESLLLLGWMRRKGLRLKVRMATGGLFRRGAGLESLTRRPD